MASYDPASSAEGVDFLPDGRVKAKSPTAMRTISEAADVVDVPAHVLRFWETKFAQIKPLKRSGGRRFYRPQDVDVLLQIKHLLYTQGYTIKGAQKAVAEYAATRAQHKAQESWQTQFAPANVNDNAPLETENTPILLGHDLFGDPVHEAPSLLEDEEVDVLAELAQALAEPEPDLFMPYQRPISREGLIALRAELRSLRDGLASRLLRSQR